MDQDQRFRTAQWILERQIGWISTADVKVGALVAIQTAMVGMLAATYSAASSRSELAILCTVLAVLCSVGAFVCAALALFPRTGGPEKSLIFFGQISSISRSDYVNVISETSCDGLLEDCAEQIHRNAEIARDKHCWLQNGMILSFVSSPLWLIAIFNLAPLKVS